MSELEPISRGGYNRLREELKKLETVDLPEVRKAVGEAREDGDLKENGAYIYGRQRQGHLEGRANELKGRLSMSDVIDCTKVDCDKAYFGTVVTLLDMDTDEKVTYQLLGPYDADIDNGSISINSPIGDCIAGRSPGEEFTASVPRGDRNFKVIEIASAEVD